MIVIINNLKDGSRLTGLSTRQSLDDDVLGQVPIQVRGVPVPDHRREGVLAGARVRHNLLPQGHRQRTEEE